MAWGMKLSLRLVVQDQMLHYHLLHLTAEAQQAQALPDETHAVLIYKGIATAIMNSDCLFFSLCCGQEQDTNTLAQEELLPSGH